MKRLAFVLFTYFFTIHVGFAQPAPTDSTKATTAEITFDNLIHDFGTIPQDGNGTCEFVFKNTGKDPLVLNNVRASCGCTTPEWSKEPIKKGKKGMIKVKYDTHRVGNFNKSITVFSNAANSTVVLTIKGTVSDASQQPTTVETK